MFDINVTLEKSYTVFDMDRAALDGDLPVGIKYMRFLAAHNKTLQGGSDIVAIFHGDACHMVLNDDSYNTLRKVSYGNPYAAMIQQLIDNGAGVEICGVTMRNHLWTKDNILTGVKVNSNGLLRLIQLAQQGYVMIRP
ncbi:MAG: DsrE family protein [Nitrospirae bacterium YQR-1]